MRKFALPGFLEGVQTQDTYERWLRRKAAAHLKRDRRRGNKVATGEMKDIGFRQVHNGLRAS